MSDSPPDGAGPCGDLPSGVGSRPSAAVEHQGRATVPGLPRHRAQAAGPQGRGQGRRAPLLARLALARITGTTEGRAFIAALGASVIMILTIYVAKRTAHASALRADVAPLRASLAPMSSAPSTPESAPPMSSAPSTLPAVSTARAPSRAPGKPRAGARRQGSKSDVVNPWGD